MAFLERVRMLLGANLNYVIEKIEDPEGGTRNAFNFAIGLGVGLVLTPLVAMAQTPRDPTAATQSQANDILDVDAWKVDAPPGSVQLTRVEPSGDVADNLLKFTFKNVSGKTIIEFKIFKSDGTGTHGTGVDRFINEGEGVLPEATLSVEFSKKDTKHVDNGDRNLQIAAIVYADGTRAGSKEELDRLEQEMMGAALEIKRDTDLLMASPDPGIAGFDAVAEKIGKSIPSTDEEASATLRGVSLAGFPQSNVYAYLNHPGVYFLNGVWSARHYFLKRMDFARSNTDTFAGESDSFNTHRKQLQSHALADLAKTMNTSCEKQAQYLRAYLGISEVAQ